MFVSDGGSIGAAPLGMPQGAMTERASSSVMVIEDQQAIAELLIDVLKDAGYVTFHSPSASEAAAFAREMRPNVICST